MSEVQQPTASIPHIWRVPVARNKERIGKNIRLRETGRRSEFRQRRQQAFGEDEDSLSEVSVALIILTETYRCVTVVVYHLSTSPARKTVAVG